MKACYNARRDTQMHLCDNPLQINDVQYRYAMDTTRNVEQNARRMYVIARDTLRRIGEGVHYLRNLASAEDAGLTLMIEERRT